MLNQKRVLFMLLGGFLLFLVAFVIKAMEAYTPGSQSNASVWMRVFGTCAAVLAGSVIYATLREDQRQQNGA